MNKVTDQLPILTSNNHITPSSLPSDEDLVSPGVSAALSPSENVFDDKIASDEKKDVLDEKSALGGEGATVTVEPGWESDEHIIVNGMDAANHLLSIRDDGDPAFTFRSIVLGTLMAAFQASMYQIYLFKPTQVTISGSFMVLITFFLGRAWAAFLPRGDLLEARWRAKGNDGPLTYWIRFFKIINPHSFGLKEHAIAAITASSASNGADSVSVFAVQNLYYDIPLNATTVILSTLSIGLFGYGLTGLLRPLTVWHVEAVYWTSIPNVKILQGLHWDTVKESKPMRVFWYCFGGMFIYEFFPAYIFPWLNSVSIPCLASMKATGSKAEILTNLFGGSLSNEGLGLFNFSFDWQYITSFTTSQPLKLQANAAIGLIVCYIAFLAVYYGNAWGGRNLPFLATTLRTDDGSKYDSSTVFSGGILDETALAANGLPRLTSTYTWAMMTGTASIGALIAHCGLFWGKDIVKTVKDLRKGVITDRHHEVMTRNYKEAPWWWYLGLIIVSFVLGLVVVLKENITLTWWSYIIALLLGSFVAPFSNVLYSRFGNGIATNSLMKMVAGSIIPGRPVGNLYFTSWSHTVIGQSVNLGADLKMGEYLKIPPRVMFLTQIWGTIFGAFINYVIMISIINSHRELLTDTNGSSAWSGQYFQSLNTQATTWALAKYLYSTSGRYFIVPLGIVIGFGLVCIHKVVCRFYPRIGRIPLTELNLPTVLMYTGYLGSIQTQSCVVLSGLLAGFYVQYYIRNYRPSLFKNYSYLVMAAFDGASLCVLFILSFAVFGAANTTVAFPEWWGNNSSGNTDLCPYIE